MDIELECDDFFTVSHQKFASTIIENWQTFPNKTIKLNAVCSFQVICLKMKIILISSSFLHESFEIIFGRIANIETLRMERQCLFCDKNRYTNIIKYYYYVLTIVNSRHWTAHNVLYSILLSIQTIRNTSFE